MSFKVGDKVICINGGNWSTVEIKPTGDLNKIQDKAPGPEKDDILTIAFIHQVETYLGLGFPEYPGDLFGSDYFRKLSEIEDLRAYKLNTTILEDLSAPIKIGKGLPQREELKELEKI